MKIGINGFGRIGRNLVRAAIERDSSIEIVAINDLQSAESLARLLAYDSTHGRLKQPVTTDSGVIHAAGRAIQTLRVNHPSKLPWRDLDVGIVAECTGWFTSREQAAMHLLVGARVVVISAPTSNPDVTICVGVNHDELQRRDYKIVSNASCTTNCAAALTSVLNAEFGIESGWLTSVHAYTNDQDVVDSPNLDVRRGRAATQNIVPTTTGAGRALGQVIPELAGRIHGIAMRVPVPDGSVVHLTCRLSRVVTGEHVNTALRAAAEAGPLAGVLSYTDGPIVSSDIIGDPHSCVVSGMDTFASGNEIRVLGWYDNEWAYANRLLDVLEILALAPRDVPMVDLSPGLITRG